MFDVLWLLFSWLPSPLNVMAFGLFCLLAVFVVVKLIIAFLQMLPFW